jgi:hypothetical protein
MKQKKKKKKDVHISESPLHPKQKEKKLHTERDSLPYSLHFLFICVSV